MSLPTSQSLDVPGARLYYEVQGSGPALMLVGHPMGASGFAPIAPLLAEQPGVWNTRRRRGPFGAGWAVALAARGGSRPLLTKIHRGRHNLLAVRRGSRKTVG